MTVKEGISLYIADFGNNTMTEPPIAEIIGQVCRGTVTTLLNFYSAKQFLIPFVL